MRALIAISLLATVVSAGVAQETTGDIRGRLVTSNGTPVAGASVSAAGRALLGTRNARSAGDGVFRILALPPGVYTVTVRALGFRPAVIDSVRVELGRTAGLQEVALETAAAKLSPVRIEAPRATLDPARTTIGATLSATDYATLPSERDYKTLMTVLPHVNTSYHGDGINVGGSTGLENAYFIDGVNVTSPLNGTAATGLPYNFVRFVEVRTGGYEAQYGKALGAIVNAVTYSGTNEFESNVFGFFTHDALSMSPKAPPLLRTTGEYSYDFGARVSGPIIRDRLWFSAAYNPRIEHADKELGTLGTFAEQRTTHQFAGKVTWQVRPATNVELSVFGDPSITDNVSIWDFLSGLEPLNPDSYLQRLENGGYNAVAKVTTPLGASGILEGSLSRSTFRDHLLSRSARGLEPLMIDFVNGTIEGGLPWTTSNAESRASAMLRATFALNRHTVTAGAEYEDSRDNNTFDNPGFGVILRNGPSFFETIDQAVHGQVQARVPIGYLQDSWRATDRLTLNAGLRWSGQWLAGNGRDIQRFPDEWQPRAGFNWQMSGPVPQRVFGSYGRFYLQEPLNLATLYYIPFTFKGGQYSVDPRLPGALADTMNESFTDEDDAPSVNDVEVENIDEVTLGYERVIGHAARMTVRLMHRGLRSSFQQGVDENGNFLLGTPGEGNLAFLPAPTRTHTALEMSIVGEWRQMQYRASYVLSRSHGNFTGLYSSDTYSANPGNNGGFAAAYQAKNSEGRLPNDVPHVFKLVTSLQATRSLSIGTFFTAMSGTPLNRFGAGPMGFFQFLAPRGSIGRSPSTWDLNARLTWQEPLGTRDARLMLDVLHVGNPRAPVRIDQFRFNSLDQYGHQANGNPRYLSPIAFQPPMMLRVGVDWTR